MTNIFLIILILLLVANNISIPFIHTPLFVLFGHPITLFHIMVFCLLGYLANYLPSPFREIIGLVVILWVLSAFGIFAIFGWFSNLLLLVIVLALLFSIFWDIFLLTWLRFRFPLSREWRSYIFQSGRWRGWKGSQNKRLVFLGGKSRGRIYRVKYYLFFNFIRRNIVVHKQILSYIEK